MMERMTDERLAEIEASCDFWAGHELVQALKAERKELRIQSEQIYDEANDILTRRIAELEGSLEEWVLDGKAIEKRIAELEADRDVHKRHHEKLSTQVIHLKHTMDEMKEARDKRIKELEARLADAHDLVDAYSACVDGYYIPSGKSVISEHDEYVQKWGDWE